MFMFFVIASMLILWTITLKIAIAVSLITVVRKIAVACFLILINDFFGRVLAHSKRTHSRTAEFQTWQV